MANTRGKNGSSDRFYWSPKSLQMVTAVMKLKDTCSLEGNDQPRQHIKKQIYHFADKVLYGQIYGFSSSRVWMWELDHKEDWVSKNWRFLIVVLEKTLESPLHSKGIKLIHPKGNQPWILLGRTDAETPILWPQDAKSNLMLGKIEGRRRRGRRDEMVGWHHRLSGHVSEQTPGDSEWQGSWCGALHGATGVRQGLATEQQWHKILNCYK